MDSYTFHQYFDNSSGDLAPLAVEGLRLVGATEALHILTLALAVFPPGGYSTDRETRWQGLAAIPCDVNGGIKPFRELSDALMNTPEDIDGLALDWLAALYNTNGIWPAIEGGKSGLTNG